MPSLEFFTFGFISTFTVAMLATWWRYVPSILASYPKDTSKYQRPELMSDLNSY